MIDDLMLNNISKNHYCMSNSLKVMTILLKMLKTMCRVTSKSIEISVVSKLCIQKTPFLVITSFKADDRTPENFRYLTQTVFSRWALKSLSRDTCLAILGQVWLNGFFNFNIWYYNWSSLVGEGPYNKFSYKSVILKLF